MPVLERYNPCSQQFEIADDLRVLSLANFSDKQSYVYDKNADIFVDVTIYDIDETAIRALRQLSRRYNNCYARVLGSPRSLQTIKDAQCGVKIVVDSTIQPFELGTSTLWPSQFLSYALSAGCDGAIVNEVQVNFFNEFHETKFFKKT